MSKLRRYLNVGFLRSFLTKTNANRGLERYRRMGITASASFLSKALTILIGFISVPLTARYLGAERYGVWITISSLLTWIALTDFGLAGNALVNVISEANGKDDRQTAREYAASSFWTLTAIGVGIGSILAFAFRWIPWRGIFEVSSAMTTEELHLTCAITILIFILTMPLNIVNSVYSAYQDGHVANIWGIASNILALLGLIVVTRFQGGLPALVLATSGTRVVVTMVNAIYLFSGRYRWLFPSLSAIRWSRVKRLFSLGGKYMVTQLSSLGIYQSQPFIITHTMGPAYVPIFAIAYKVITVPVDLSYIATTPILAATSEARARDDWRWIQRAFKNATLVCIAVGVPATIVIAFAGKILVRILGGSPLLVPDWSVIAWLAVYTLISVTMMSSGQVICGIERVGLFAISLSLCAAVTIGLGVAFAYPWGLAGVAAAMAIAKVLTFLPLQGYQVLRFLRNSSAQMRRVDAESLVS